MCSFNRVLSAVKRALGLALVPPHVHIGQLNTALNLRVMRLAVGHTHLIKRQTQEITQLGVDFDQDSGPRIIYSP